MRAPGGRWSRLAWPAGFAAAGIALFLLYRLQSARSATVNSDGASNAMQAWAMLHGNVLLHGWTVSDVSFYTTELPEYALVEAVRGLNAGVVHTCGAISYTLLVLLTGALAIRKNVSRRTALVSAAIAMTPMLAPELGLPSDWLLLSPDHVGTGVPLLLAWLIVDRADLTPDRTDLIAARAETQLDPVRRSRRAARWAVPVVVGLLLAWTAIGDQLAEVIAAMPLALACGLRVVWARFRLQLPLRDLAYELSLALAAVASIPVAWLGVKLISALGGWSITPPRTGLAAPGVIGRNVALTGNGILQLFGAGFSAGQPAMQNVFAAVHLAGLALAALALFLALRGFFTQQLVVQVLAVAIAVNIAAYIFTVQAESIATTREIAAVLPFGAALAGRLLGPLLTERPAGATRPRRPAHSAERPAHSATRSRRTAIAASAVAALAACYLAMLGYNATRPPVPDQVAQLASWLAVHHLTHGLGGYWQSNAVTVDSGGVIQVRSIAINGGRLTSGAYWEAESSWYDPGRAYADFIVNAPPAWHPDAAGDLVQQMETTAGKPARIYHIKGYTIAAWRQNLLARLG